MNEWTQEALGLLREASKRMAHATATGGPLGMQHLRWACFRCQIEAHLHVPRQKRQAWRTPPPRGE